MHTKNDKIIYFAPLQESTDSVYRNLYSAVFKNIDKYFAPYIARQNDGSIKKSHLREISSEKNKGYKLIPQIMAENSEDFLFLANTLTGMGYTEINWNLGCPYPMATNKGLGSGLLPSPDKIKRIISDSLPKLSCSVSVKLRSGLLSSDEIFSVIPVLNEFPLEEVILHPRIAKQLYKGEADTDIFNKIKEISKHPLVYNGDIVTLDDFIHFENLFQNTPAWMIGRGILKDPFLPSKIKTNIQYSIDEKIRLLHKFQEGIFEEYSKLLSGKSHLLMRMLKFWSYFCYSFPDPHKTLKRIKKAGTVEKYNAAVRENFLRLTNDEKD